MIQSLLLAPGVTLRSYQDRRFKQGCLSIQFLRPMAAEEAAMNALLGSVLLRGCRSYPTLRSITFALDDRYGGAVSPLVRRVGDWQCTGLSCAFMDDRFALPGDKVLEPMVDFLRQVLLEPLTENGIFREDFVESEKKNLISAIECDRNDKQLYATTQLLRHMCRGDSFGLPRLGTAEQVAAITPQALYRHYESILEESPIELFYVGSAALPRLEEALRPIVDPLRRNPMILPPQTGLTPCPGSHVTEIMDITQSKLCLGFTTPIRYGSADFPAMQLLNTVFGGGMTSRLFQNVREKQSLCYSIGSAYYSAKGIVLVSAGIDSSSRETVEGAVMQQLALCAQGDIRPEELDAAKQATLSALRATYDSPGAIEGYYSTAALWPECLSVETYLERISAVTLPALQRCAQSLQYHSSFFLTDSDKRGLRP